MVNTSELDDYLTDHPEILMDAYYEAQNYLQGRLLNEHNQSWAFRLMVAHIEEEYQERDDE